MTDILSLRAGQCRYCISDDMPFVFCARPVAGDSAYCVPHHRLCHSGFGRVTAEALAEMIYGIEQTVVCSRRSTAPTPLAVDVVVGGVK